ncbi:unnamed protein product [Clonostachys rosea f. rosea IK726]|uniref:Uncharacterized protein n=1 Tax=Clonostachys rosea f. rosea IK726 TaxID=1349383 RepID=A0ACA9TQ70_BIOOC|nr:unnamed protein product [Clonostachys rosea f. rosea IK726]
MYNTETPPEIAPENPPESFTADGDTTNNETVSMLALHRCAHTPALSALGMPSISSAGVDTPSSGSLDLLSGTPDTGSQQASARMSEIVTPLSAANTSSETNFSNPQVEDIGLENPDEAEADLLAPAGPVHGHANLAMHGFLVRRDDPFVPLIHPGNTRAYIDQSKQEMAERIEMMMTPFLGRDGL